MKHLVRPLAPLLVAAGAAILIFTAGAEIAGAIRSWLFAGQPWPHELMLHVLIAGAALLLASAVIMTRRSAQRTEEAEAALRESEERLRLIANNVPALISYVDREQRYQYSNRTYADWFGIQHEGMRGKTIAEIFGDEIYGRMRPEIERALAGTSVQFELTTGDGTKRRTLQVNCVPQHGAGGEVLGFYTLAADVTALKRAQEDLRYAAIQLQHDARRLEFLAHHDTLTGLPNRAMSYRIGEHQVNSGASIGIACVPQDGDDVATLLRLADLAMYRAKELGRNGYQFFSVMLNEDAAAAAALVEELRQGMTRGELFLVYQPRIDIATRQVVGAEALLRWRHPKDGVLAPESFLPPADHTGLLGPLGARALREACAQGRRWIDDGISPLSVAVNVTSRQLRDGRIAEHVRAALAASGLPAESPLIEVSESVVRQVPESLEAALIAITNLGARLSVDDFGTGYASLPTLQRLRASSVCIDRKLISGVPQDTERARLAKGLLPL